MPKKIVFILPAILAGGAEKVLLTLVQHLDRAKFEPVVVYMHKNIEGEKTYPKDVKIICLDKKSPYDVFRLLLSIYRILKQEKPALVFPMMPYCDILTIMAGQLLKEKIPTIISVHNNSTLQFQHENFPAVKNWLARHYFPQADLVHCVSEGIKTDLMANFGISADKIQVIYNPFDLEEISRKAREEVEHPWFRDTIPVLAAVGRLAPAKNFPLLFRALRRVLAKTPVRLVMVGDGPERQHLEQYARKQEIAPHVAFVGFQMNPYKYMARAKAFVLSSSWEGLANVIIEAMACGVPVISTRCPYGPEDIITHGVNGYLVPVNQERDMAEAILDVFGNATLHQQLVQGGLNRAQDFSFENILPQYESMFLNYAR